MRLPTGSKYSSFKIALLRELGKSAARTRALYMRGRHEDNFINW